MVIDEAKLKADLDYFLPVVRLLAHCCPGDLGNTLLALLQAIDSDEVLSPAVSLVNEIVGATK